MKTFKSIIEIIGLSFLVANSLIMSYVVISAYFSGWKVLFYTNALGEGKFEMFIVPIFTVIGIIAVAKYIRILKQRSIMENRKPVK